MNRINGITVMIEQVQVVSHYLHEPQLLPALNDKVNGRNSMSHSFMNQNSVLLSTRSLLLWDLLLSCASQLISITVHINIENTIY